MLVFESHKGFFSSLIEKLVKMERILMWDTTANWIHFALEGKNGRKEKKERTLSPGIHTTENAK